MTDPFLQLDRISKRFGSVEAVAPTSMTIESGEFVVLVGPSGCGKTTMLRMIAGLEDPTTGDVLMNGVRITETEPADRDMAMVFQQYALYPHMTVEQNLGFGLRMRGTPPPDIARSVRQAAELLGLGDLLSRRPGQLSGGQRQRVALGRAIVRKPSLFLFDEPLSNLDAQLRTELRHELTDLHRHLGTSMILVTHDQVEAMTLGDRIAVFDDGVLQQFAPPLEVYGSPANLGVARFIGSPRINIAVGAMDADSFIAGAMRMPAPRLVTSAVTMAVRPEHVRLTTADQPASGFPTTVRRVEPLGADVLIHVDGPTDGVWILRQSPLDIPVVGTPVHVHVDPATVLLFGADGSRLTPDR